MSITFAPTFQPSDVIGHRVSCACGDAKSPTIHARRANAMSEMQRGDVACGDDYCGADCTCVEVVESTNFPFVNMSNRNAQSLLDVLGLTWDDNGGEATADDLLGRILIAEGIYGEDHGVPSEHTRRSGGGLLVDCGREPGYINDRLVGLREVAEAARKAGRTVTWC